MSRTPAVGLRQQRVAEARTALETFKLKLADAAESKSPSGSPGPASSWRVPNLVEKVTRGAFAGIGILPSSGT